MLSWALTFLIIALIAGVFGFTGVYVFCLARFVPGEPRRRRSGTTRFAVTGQLGERHGGTVPKRFHRFLSPGLL
jgi:hypothetical protein